MRGGRGGVKAGWRRPDRRTGAPGIIAGAGAGAGGPPHAGDGGKVGKGADRRAWGVWRGPGGAGGCAVVIPWRGFRCFTHDHSAQVWRSEGKKVVIPWRGFRCFTHSGAELEVSTATTTISCNPLAGI